MSRMNPSSIIPAKKKMKIAAAIILALAIAAAGLFVAPKDESTGKYRPATDNIKEASFARLAEIRRLKKDEVIKYFTSIENKAKNVSTDGWLRKIFFAGRQQNNSELESKFDEIYATRYGEFYDLLMVDAGGFVFNSVRHESDYLSNIFSGKSPLIQKNKLNRNQQTFIDYHEYPPSQESASFFFVPIKDKGSFAGWIVLQCPINRVNRILSQRDGLGRTGEVYLVNQQMLLLSESRFINESSALKLKIDTEAVRNALTFEQGERIVEDYRGVRVFSSFEKFHIFGASWIIIAEMDEAEILTEAFRQTDASIYPALVEVAQKYISNDQSISRPSRNGRVVDINEFQRSADGARLLTYGVASCSAVLIQLPSRFAYLTHISPMDDIYQGSVEKGQNLLRQLLRRITYFDLLPVEKKDVQFVLIAPHGASLNGTVRTILENGFDLSNIRVAINKNSRGANVALDSYDQLSVEWYGEKGLQRHNALTLPTLQNLFSELVAYN